MGVTVRVGVRHVYVEEEVAAHIHTRCGCQDWVAPYCPGNRRYTLPPPHLHQIALQYTACNCLTLGSTGHTDCHSLWEEGEEGREVRRMGRKER